MGYIGGAASHVWTPGEWGPFHAVRQYPVWVAGTASGAIEGYRAAEAVLDLGWASHQGYTRVVICDMETDVDPSWYASWAATITDNGFLPVCYGSLSTVLGNAAADVLAADWD